MLKYLSREKIKSRNDEKKAENEMYVAPKSPMTEAKESREQIVYNQSPSWQLHNPQETSP